MRLPRPLDNIAPRAEGGFWDGVTWAMRIGLAGLHLLFSLAFYVRPNLPLIVPSFDAFDDQFSAVWWAHLNLLAGLGLLLIPTRAPWGALSTMFSAFVMTWIGLMFWAGPGLVPASLHYTLGYSLAGWVLMLRALWVLWGRLRLGRHLQALGARRRKRGGHV